ncbi:MAG: type II secretion system protein GspD [Candidatus Omnitrophica bacterium]|nr:type II secretion system protein GspD [Candidatus Omnitrophota bacterium]
MHIKKNVSLFVVSFFILGIAFSQTNDNGTSSNPYNKETNFNLQSWPAISKSANLSREKKEFNKDHSTNFIKKSDKVSLISIDAKDINVIDILKILNDKGNFNLSISGNVKGPVTVFLKDVEVWDALEIVFASAKLAYVEKKGAINVMTEREYELQYGKKFWDKRKLMTYNLQYAKAEKVKELLLQMASKIGKIVVDLPTNTVVILDIPSNIEQMIEVLKEIDRPLATKVFELNYLLVEDIEQNIAEMLNKDIGNVKGDKSSNKLVVTDYPDKLAEIEKMLIAFDEKPLQVLINAKILEIKPSKEFHSGINWDYWINKYFRIKGSFSISSSSTSKLSFGTIGLGDVNNVGEYSSIVEFLEVFGDTKILSSPRILALNNQEAKILVGTKDVYITSSVSELGDSAVTTQTVNFVDVGVKLYVTPRINREGYIILKIKPEISSSQREVIKTANTETEIPIVTTSEAETSVIVRDGVSIIIGGLRKITRDKQKKQIPILGSIPILGIPFRSKKDEWSKNELVIVLTPQIVSGDISIENELIERIEKKMNNESNNQIDEREIISELKNAF